MGERVGQAVYHWRDGGEGQCGALNGGQGTHIPQSMIGPAFSWAGPSFSHSPLVCPLCPARISMAASHSPPSPPCHKEDPGWVQSLPFIDSVLKIIIKGVSRRNIFCFIHSVINNCLWYTQLCYIIPLSYFSKIKICINNSWLATLNGVAVYCLIPFFARWQQSDEKRLKHLFNKIMKIIPTNCKRTTTVIYLRELLWKRTLLKVIYKWWRPSALSWLPIASLGNNNSLD